MDEETAFLQALLASPEDPLPRLAYADWLEKQADPRAELLRSDWNMPRLSYVDWLANQGDLDYYLQKFPELRSQLPVHEALRETVVDGRLWYVLLHSRTGLPPDGSDRGPWVVLFAVGRSPRGDRLLGVVSHQVCHNLCD